MLCYFFVTASVFAKPSFIKVNGYDVEYEIAGSGKHTVFLEAGGSAGLFDWEPVFEKLAKEARIIRYSRIGNGGSTQLKKTTAWKSMQTKLSCYLKGYTLKNQSSILLIHMVLISQDDSLQLTLSGFQPSC